MAASAALKILLIGEDRSAGRTLKGVGNDAEHSASRLGRLNKAAFALAAGGLAAAGAAALKFSKGAAEDDAAARRLARTIKATTGATEAQIAANEDWITAQGKAVGVADDELRPALAKLVVATKDVGKAQKLAQLAMDISAATGKDLGAVSMALTKAQYGQTTALGKLGVKVSEVSANTTALKSAQLAAHKAQTAYNKAVDENGKSSTEAREALMKLEIAQGKVEDATGKVKKQALDTDTVMKELAKTYGGDAADAAETVEGKQRRMTIALSEAGETIGYKLIPAMTKLAEFGLATIDWMEDNSRIVKPLAIGLGGLAVSIVAVNTATKGATAAMAAFNTVSKANPTLRVLGAVTALVGGLALLKKATQDSTEEAKIAVGPYRDYMSTLDGVNAAATKATRALALERLERSGLLEVLVRTGISERTAVNAVLGNLSARQKLANVLRTNKDLTEAQREAIDRETGSLVNAQIAQLKANVATAEGAKELRAARQALRDFYEQPSDKLVRVLGVEEAKRQIRDLSTLLSGALTAGSTPAPSGLGGFEGLFRTPKPPRYATGTVSSAAGLALVGEAGAELVSLPARSRIYSATQTRGLLSAQRSAALPPINVHFHGVVGDPIQAGRQIVDVIRKAGLTGPVTA